MESKIVVDMHLLKINRDLCKSYDTVYKFLLIYINYLKSDIMKKNSWNKPEQASNISRCKTFNNEAKK